MSAPKEHIHRSCLIDTRNPPKTIFRADSDNHASVPNCSANCSIKDVPPAYFGFSDLELKTLDKFVRNNTSKKYGPVREVEKTFVIEIAFDSVNYSKRHKSGVALRFPRIKRLREDKPVQEVLQLSQFKLDFGLDAK